MVMHNKYTTRWSPALHLVGYGPTTLTLLQVINKVLAPSSSLRGVHCTGLNDAFNYSIHHNVENKNKIPSYKFDKLRIIACSACGDKTKRECGGTRSSSNNTMNNHGLTPEKSCGDFSDR